VKAKSEPSPVELGGDGKVQRSRRVHRRKTGLKKEAGEIGVVTVEAPTDDRSLLGWMELILQQGRRRRKTRKVGKS
jgi:hypothetical protein